MKHLLIICMMFVGLFVATPAHANNKATVEFHNGAAAINYTRYEYVVPAYNLSLHMDRISKTYQVGFTGYYNDGGVMLIDVSKETYEKVRRYLYKMED